nr:DUF2381 family protein [Myxococcus sp. RHSTA-1-4]
MFPGPSLLLVLLCGTGAAAQAPSMPQERQQARRIELGTAPRQIPPEISIHPGTASLLLFDTPIAHGGVELEGRERFSRVAVGTDTLALLPSEALREGERLRLTVRFEAGTEPAEARLLLVVREQADAQLEFVRARRPSEPTRMDPSGLAEELERLREENARLRAERGPGGLTGAITASWMQRQGIANKQLQRTDLRITGAELQMKEAVSFRAMTRVAVDLTVALSPHEPPWTSGSAVLRGPEGHRLRIVQVWQSAPPEGAPPEVRITVEAEASRLDARGTYILELREADGDRTLTFSPLTFPDP